MEMYEMLSTNAFINKYEQYLSLMVVSMSRSDRNIWKEMDNVSHSLYRLLITVHNWLTYNNY